MTNDNHARFCLRCGVKWESKAFYPCIRKGERAEDHTWIKLVEDVKP